MPRSALLIVNRSRPEAAGAAQRVRQLIERHGRFLGEIDSAEKALPASAGEADLIVVLGGDGSILGEARRCLGLRAAMLGVNIGRLGFIAEFEPESLEAQAPAIFGSGPLPTRKLALVHATIVGKGGKARDAGLAVNEVVVTAGPPYRVVELRLSIDGVPGPVFSGDGLIVSTPTGSTAYNVSAGGPIVHPAVDAMTITPIAAHSLAFRPIVVSGNARIELSIHRANRDNGGGTTLILDGQVHHAVDTGDRVMLTRGEHVLHFVMNPAGNYWSTLIHKLRWAEPPRMRPG